ncbi:MAG: 50S ribosomal protein L4 [Patescibacteria group bacterium]|jgi:large subunit ribosomal protein L4
MSIKIKVQNQEGAEVGEMNLSDKVFGVEANNEVLRQVVTAMMANKRKVLAHTKTRSNVRGGGKKPWKQKGTGRARAGTIRSPLWKGGGITFGPLKERNFKLKINKKTNRKAICMVMSDRVKDEKFFVLNELKLEEYKTKKFEEVLNKILGSGKISAQEVKPVGGQGDKAGAKAAKKKEKKRSAIVVLDKKDDKAARSGKNLEGVRVINLDNINVLDLLKYREMIITEPAVKKLEEKYGSSGVKHSQPSARKSKQK